MMRILIALLLTSFLLSCGGDSKKEPVSNWESELSLLLSKLSYDKNSNKVVLAE